MPENGDFMLKVVNYMLTIVCFLHEILPELARPCEPGQYNPGVHFQ